jgi:hypothetical protein
MTGVGPHRVQLRRTKGWRMPENTVSVARPGPFGNPWTVKAAFASGYGSPEAFQAPDKTVWFSHRLEDTTLRPSPGNQKHGERE